MSKKNLLDRTLQDPDGGPRIWVLALIGAVCLLLAFSPELWGWLA